MDDRLKELVLAAAQALGEARDPLDRAFFAEHKVTIDEADTLSDVMALGLLAFAASPGDVAMLAIVGMAQNP